MKLDLLYDKMIKLQMLAAAGILHTYHH